MSENELQNKFEFKTVKKRPAGRVLYIIGLVLLFIAILLLFSLNWMFAKFGHVSIDSTLYTLTAPKTGTDMTYIYTFLYMSLLPSIVVEAIVIVLTNNLYRRNVLLKIQTAKGILAVRVFPCFPLRRAMIFISVIALVCSSLYVSSASGLTEYVQSKTTETSLYNDYYVDPETANLKFPEKKRNLIYLYVESLEKTLESKEEGGGKSSNILPNLTELQKKYIAVADESGKQGHVLKGGDWTMAGMVSQSAAIPLMININLYNYNADAKYLPGAFSLGQILGDNGYKNIFISGCDSKFAATDLYFKQHGNYEIIDPDGAKKKGYIPEDYNVFWGYEDLKMFEILKKEITANYESGQPFNIAAATLDTHADDIYICENCDKSIADEHDRVYHCTDEQVANFIKWFEQQPCYEDTTLVISGDHCSFATTYFDDCKNYDRTVFSMFVNAQVEKKDYVRTFATLDMLPSTLAAMGVEIEGDRLGLGTNLFSDTETLCEELGIDTLNRMLSQNSTFYTDQILQGSDKDILNISRVEEDNIEIHSADEMYNQYYVNPDDVKLTFPQKKQNLIYLIVESLEKTWETKENDGVQTKDVIPYLTQLQKDYVKVENEVGNQGYVCYGGEYTIKGMVSQTAGIPLTDPINADDYPKDYEFIPGASTLGDVLKKQGYKNVFISGFDTKFAATDKYFKQHGDYDIIDAQSAKDRGYIAKDYEAGWGFNDTVMFDILKDQVTQMSKSDQPFSIMAATLDTHADDVYIDENSSTKFTEEHEQAFNSTDDKIKAFLEWFKTQPAYENTTIVISGDHLSYAEDYFTQFTEEYDRTAYSVFVNAKIDNHRKYMKAFSTLDMFPSTLAAMGVEIEGNRLGLGVNLFAELEPLLLKFGYHQFNTFLAEDCQFYNEKIMKRNGWTGKVDTDIIEDLERQALLPQTPVKKTTQVLEEPTRATAAPQAPAVVQQIAETPATVQEEVTTPPQEQNSDNNENVAPSENADNTNTDTKPSEAAPQPPTEAPTQPPIVPQTTTAATTATSAVPVN